MMDLAIPSSQLMILGGLIALCLILGRFKVGLSIAFACTFYWYFIEQRDLFFVNLETSSPYVLLYFLSGIVLIVFTLLSFVTSE
jgi:hypothetical protein